MIALLMVAVTVQGCATAEKLKQLPDEKLYFSKYASESKKELVRREFVKRNAKWSEAVKQNVLAGKLELGMTDRQVLASFGKPLEILGTVNEAKRSHELWIYPKTYLIFDNSELVSIEEVIRFEVKPPIVERERYDNQQQ